MDDWLSVAIVSGISQGLLLCILIIILPVGNRSANIMLACFVALQVHTMLMHAVTELGDRVPLIFYSAYLLAVLKGPSLYLYVKALTSEDFSLKKDVPRHLWIFVPVVLYFAVALSGQGLTETMDTEQLFSLARTFSIYQIISLIALVYAIMALRLLDQHSTRIESSFSFVENINLSWLKWLIILMIAGRIAHLLVEVIYFFDLLERRPKTNLVLFFNIISIYIITIGGMRQPIIFTKDLRTVLDLCKDKDTQESEDPVLVASTDVPEEKKYKRTGLNEEKIEYLWHQLNTVMSEKKPYLDSTLSLPQLAEMLGIKPHDLSCVLNASSESNFYKLINSYRIDEAKQLLDDPANDRRKMLDIAMEVGYSSQSTFYNHFKKHVGVTPRKYKLQRS